jgi:hypothetical protein
MKKLILLISLLLLIPATCFGATLILSWNASSGATGYKLCFGKTSRGSTTGYSSFKYSTEIDAKNLTTVTVNNFETVYGRGTFYFSVVAYNTSATSDYSSCTSAEGSQCNLTTKEIFLVVPNAPLPPVIKLYMGP